MGKLIRFILMLFLIVFGDLFAQTPPQTATKPQPVDSVEIYRNQHKNKETWEQIVSFPGTIVSLPLVLFFEMQEQFVGYAYENKLIPKTIDFFTSADGRRGIEPTYSSRSGGGFKFYQEGILNPGSKLSIKASGSLYGRQHYQIEFKRLRIYRILSFRIMSEYRYLLGEAFYGIGPGTRGGDRVDYDHELLTVESDLGIQLSKDLTINTQVGVERHNIFGNNVSGRPSIKESYNENSLPGLKTRVEITRFQIGFQYDSKNRPGNPSHGKEINFSASTFQDMNNNLYDFWQIMADITQYIYLFKNRVISLRVVGETTEPYKNSQIPFYYLSSFGRYETIRGFNRGRFRDQDMLLGSIEYHIPLWHSIDTNLFIDAGQVSNDIFKNFRTDNFQFGYGIGWRLWNSKKLIATLEFALSKERFRIYFNLN